MKSFKQPFYGWWIVGAGGVVQWYTSAVFWRGFQAFVPHILGTFGWSHGATAAAISLQRSESGMISPFVGALLDKYGPRKAMAFGVFVTGGGFIFMSQMQTLWHFYIAISLLTLGMSFGTFIVFVVTVANWFVRKRARALATLMSFSAIGGLTLPLLVASIEQFGWREMLMATGIGFWIIGFPATLVMRKRPEDHGMLPDGDVVDGDDSSGKQGGRFAGIREHAITMRQAIKLRFFWQLAIVTSLGQLVSSTNLFHFSALLEYGMTTALAASAAGAVAIGDLTGRAGIAVLGDRYDKRKMLTVAMIMQTLGVAGLAGINATVFGIDLGLWPLPFFILFFGLGFGASIPLRLSILGDYFGRASYGSIVGLTSSVNAIFGAAGPALVGLIHDLQGSYRMGFTILAVMLLISIPMAFTLEPSGRVAAKARAITRRNFRERNRFESSR
ncbi:MAG TPA: MFS transporter [Dehalococcoidia bacterium]|jgi:MFS family permease|nr:MFS transporter [Dehalococcoidia bacterium]HIK89275.1 MFS transporter [Dehalococcoidia bacterium]